MWRCGRMEHRPKENDAVPVYRNPGRPVKERVEDLLSRMTLEEKIAQLRAESEVPLYKKENGNVEPSDELLAILSGATVGKLMSLLRADPFFHLGAEEALTARQCAELSNRIHRYVQENTRLGIPVIIGNEGNHALMGMDATIFPAVCNFGCTWNVDLMEDIGRAIALEGRSRGEVIVYAPDLDVIRDPRYGRSDQNYGEDPHLVGRMGAAMVRGMQGESVADRGSVVSMLRSNPGSGDAEGGHDFGDTSRGSIEMHEVVLRPWADGVRAGAEAIMAGCATYDRIPLWADRHLLTEVLRDQWGFQGFVMTDGWVSFILECRMARDRVEAAAMALKAGVDMAWPDGMVRQRFHDDPRQAVFGRLAEALDKGLVSTEDIDLSVRRVLRVKFLLGLFEDPYVDPEEAASASRCPAHRELALKAARESVVLLKNDKDILPLHREIRSIAVIGPNADDEWAQLGDYAPAHRPEDVVTVLQGIRELAASNTRVEYARGCGIRTTSKDGFPDAISAALSCDIVIAVVGGSSKGEYFEEKGLWTARRSAESDCGEGTDRMSLDLLGVQEELLRELKETGKPLVVVLIHGRAMSIPWIAEYADAVVDAGYPGEAGGAVAEVLFGDYNPGGRLAVSVPRHVGQLPVYYYSRRPSRRDYAEMDASPLYPFGFGLSYSTFEYRNLEVTPTAITAAENAQVSLEVANTGTRAGDVVVQLYIRDEVASVARPWKQLQGFARINLKPGESRRVEFEVGREQLCFFNQSGEWVVEPGEFTLIIGRNAKEELLCATLTVTA